MSTDGSTPHPPVAGRYHLYVSLACPWAHRTLLARRRLDLVQAIGVSVVHPLMGADGWTFAAGDGCVADQLHQSQFLREIYLRADPHATSRVTVPVLWDKETETIVNNESLEIIQMFDELMPPGKAAGPRWFPPALKPAILEMIAANYETVNNGVYRAGFARTQAAYEDAVGDVFARLDELEALLAQQRYLLGEAITAADYCLFTTLLRFDPVYVGHFKCNLRRLVDYPKLWAFTREIHQLEGVAATCNLAHIKRHYYGSHPSINPKGIIPVGPAFDLDAPHLRG